MSKVKLVVCEGYGSQGNPRLGGTEKIIDLDLELPDSQNVMGIIRTNFEVEPDGSKRVSDGLNPVVRYERINTLVGKLLTVMDATFTDLEQRKAMKDIVKQVAWDWYDNQNEELVSVWQVNKSK